MAAKESGRPEDILLNSVIDSGGGDIMSKVGRVLRRGGKVVVYGMCVYFRYSLLQRRIGNHYNRTANPKITFTMREVLKNQRLIGRIPQLQLSSSTPLC